jgi:flagellar protein FliS
MSNRLLVGNLQNDPAMVQEVQRLLTELKQAWDGIDPATAAVGQMAQAGLSGAGAYGGSVPRPTGMIKA